MSEREQPNPDDIERDIEHATEKVQVQAAKLDELSGSSAAGQPLGIDGLMGVPVRVTVQIGRAKMTLSELLELAPGSLVALDREAHEPADVLVNGRVVARGEIVTIDDVYGVRITSVQDLA